MSETSHASDSGGATTTGSASNERFKIANLDEIIAPVTVSSFVAAFAEIIYQFRTLSGFWYVMNSIGQGISFVQFIIISLFPSYNRFWKNFEARNIVSFLSVILRIIPVTEDIMPHDFAVLTLFLYSLSVWIVLCLLFFVHQSTHFFVSKGNKVFIIVILMIFKILEYPTMALFAYELLNVQHTNGVLLVIFAAITFLLTIFGSIFLDVINYSFPSINTSLASQWITPNIFSVHIFSNVLVFVCEIIDIIDNIPAETCFVAFNIIFNIVCFGVQFYILPCTTFYSNVIVASTHLIAIFIDIFVMVSIFYHEVAPYIVPVAITSLIPITTIASYVISYRQKYIISVFKEARDTQDMTKVNKYSERAIITGVCLSFQEKKGDWSLFDNMISKYKNSYLHHIIYSKVVLLFPEEQARFIALIIRMRHLQGQFARRRALTYLFECILVQQTPPTNWTIIGSNCNRAVDDYFTTLQLFWTEILLGRPDRLIALSTAVNNRYYEAEKIFAENGVNELTSNHYQRFRSVCWQRDPEKFVEKQLLNVVLRESYKAFNIGNTTPVTNSFGTEVNRCLAVEEIQQESKRSMCLYHRLVFSTPFYYAFCILITVIVYVIIMNSQVTKIWELYQRITKPFFTMAALLYAFPLTAATASGAVNRENLSQYFHNNVMYSTKFIDPIADVNDLLSRTSNYLPPMIHSFDEFPFPDEVNEFYTTTFNTSLLFANNTQSNQMSFIATLMLFITQFQNIADKNIDDIVNMFNTTEAERTVNTFIDLLTFLGDFLEKYTENLSERMTQSVISSTKIFFNVMYALFLFSIIVIIVSFVFLKKSYDKLYSILFALPKNEVSELMTKLGKKKSEHSISTSQLDCDLKYNLNQLSIQAPPHTFLTFKQIAVRSLLLPIVLSIIFLLLLHPALLLLKSNITISMANLKSTQSTTVTPLYYFIIGTDIAEIMIITMNNFTGVPNRKDQLLEELYNVTSKTYYDRIPTITYLEDFPSIISLDLFLNSNNCSEGQPYSLCLSMVGSILSTIAYSFDFDKKMIRNEPLDDLTRMNILGFVCTTVSLIVPKMADDIFDAIFVHTKMYLLTGDVSFFYNLFAMVFLYYASCFIMRNFSNRVDFSNSILSSIPIQVITECYGVFKEIQNQERKNGEIDEMLFESPETFQAITDIILLVDSDNIVIEATPATQSRLLFDPVGMTLQKLLLQIKPYQFEIQLPPTAVSSFHIDVRVPSADSPDAISLLMKINLLPLKKFEYNGKQIAYACIMDDETQHESLVMQMNNEANRVRMLMTQLVPYQVAGPLLASEDVQRLILSKVLTSSFILCGFENLNPLDIRTIQALIREQLNNHRKLTYMGRSVQMFRVLSGVFDTNNISFEEVMDIVTFAMDLMNSLRTEYPCIEFRCGIHISGPFFADVISKEQPPIYDLYGNSMSISSLIATNCPPNQVNVSRPVYIEIIDHGFEIGLVTEITRMNGEIISIYKIDSI